MGGAESRPNREHDILSPALNLNFAGDSGEARTDCKGEGVGGGRKREREGKR